MKLDWIKSTEACSLQKIGKRKRVRMSTHDEACDEEEEEEAGAEQDALPSPLQVVIAREID
jgi:hypothetical protein